MKNKAKQTKVQKSKKLRREKLATMRDNKQLTSELYALWAKESK